MSFPHLSVESGGGGETLSHLNPGQKIDRDPVKLTGWILCRYVNEHFKLYISSSSIFIVVHFCKLNNS